MLFILCLRRDFNAFLVLLRQTIFFVFVSSFLFFLFLTSLNEELTLSIYSKELVTNVQYRLTSQVMSFDTSPGNKNILFTFSKLIKDKVIIKSESPPWGFAIGGRKAKLALPDGGKCLGQRLGQVSLKAQSSVLQLFR
jgi:hypothetical protein